MPNAHDRPGEAHAAWAALAAAPRGCVFEDRPGGGWVARAAMRSVRDSTMFLLVMLFWNGVVGIFVFEAICGIQARYFGHSSGLPMRGNLSNIANGGPGLVFLCVFLIPFIFVGAMLLWDFLDTLIGRVEVVRSGEEVIVRTGIGPLGKVQRFDAGAVTEIQKERTAYMVLGVYHWRIRVEANVSVGFGMMLPEERRYWLEQVLRALLIDRPSRGRESAGDV